MSSTGLSARPVAVFVGTSCGCVLQKYKKTETPHEPQRQQNKLLNITTFLVIRSGFEPETHSLEGCCSILSNDAAAQFAFKLFACCP